VRFWAIDIPSMTCACTGKLVKITANNRRFEARRGSNHLNVILTRPDADRHIATNVA